MGNTPANNRQRVISILAKIKQNSKAIPFEYAEYTGNAKTYMVWMQTDMGNTMSADDNFQSCAEYFDISVYSNKDYTSIVESLITEMESDELCTFQPSRCSEDFYDTDTQMYHKTLCFAFYKTF